MKQYSVILGNFLQQQRLARHLSRAELAQRLTLSEKTLQRIEQGQVEIKASQLLTFMTFFGVTSAEIVALTAGECAPSTVLQQLHQAQTQADIPALQALEARLAAAYQQQHIPWQRCAVTVCRILQAQAHQSPQAQQLASRLCAYYLQCETLTRFDFQLLTMIVGCAPYAQAIAFITGGQVKAQRDHQQALAVLADYFIGLLTSALATQEAQVISCASQLILRQQDLAQAGDFSMYQRLAKWMLMWLAGEPQAATAGKTALVHALAVVYPPSVAHARRAIIEHLWQILIQTRTAGVSSQHLLPRYSWRSDAAVVEALGGEGR
ncbi:helix-turn-helix domain-containing protein [Lacticaseibacillus baoqingensis]|uniref:Helix-turn-helix domain-containing protein n=1 Tax=Lacticaseibacillus baoqingensis TaxID=2486013 RepID=A0ABW4E1V8_9LACO|nr:helix-turn-helix transcriptional regulator [Lacticaseibacillus baoqingensis]